MDRASKSVPVPPMATGEYTGPERLSVPDGQGGMLHQPQPGRRLVSLLPGNAGIACAIPNERSPRSYTVTATLNGSPVKQRDPDVDIGLLVNWGTEEARHRAIVSVGTGQSITITASDIDVSVLNFGHHRYPELFTGEMSQTVDVSIHEGGTPQAWRFSERVTCPFNTLKSLPELQAMSIEQVIRELVHADTLEQTQTRSSGAGSVDLNLHNGAWELPKNPRAGVHVLKPFVQDFSLDFCGGWFSGAVEDIAFSDRLICLVTFWGHQKMRQGPNPLSFPPLTRDALLRPLTRTLWSHALPTMNRFGVDHANVPSGAVGYTVASTMDLSNFLHLTGPLQTQYDGPFEEDLFRMTFNCRS